MDCSPPGLYLGPPTLLKMVFLHSLLWLSNAPHRSSGAGTGAAVLRPASQLLPRRASTGAPLAQASCCGSLWGPCVWLLPLTARSHGFSLSSSPAEFVYSDPGDISRRSRTLCIWITWKSGAGKHHSNWEHFGAMSSSLLIIKIASCCYFRFFIWNLVGLAVLTETHYWSFVLAWCSLLHFLPKIGLLGYTGGLLLFFMVSFALVVVI